MIVGSEGFLVSAGALFFLIFLPGILISYVLFPGPKLDWLERIPAGFALGLSAFLVPIVAARTLGLSWNGFLWIWIFVEAAIVVTAALFHWRKSPRDQSAPPRTIAPARARRVFAVLLVLFFAALLVGSLLTLFTPRDEDDWSYLADIRALADTVRFSPIVLSGQLTASERDLVHPWWFLHALIVHDFGVDPVRLVQDWMPLIFAPVSLLAFYALARSLLGQNLALLASLLNFAFLITDLFNPDESVPWPGWWIFARIDQDHTIVVFALLPVFAAFVIRFVEQGDWQWLAAAFLVEMGMLGTHALLGLVLTVLTVGSFLIVQVVFARKAQEWKRVALLAAAIGTAFLIAYPGVVYFFYRVMGVGARMITAADTVFPLNRYRYTFLSPTDFTLRWDFVTQPPALAAVLLIPFLIPFLRRSIAARYLFGSILGLLLVLYYPPVFTSLETHMGVTILRLWNWIPKALVIAFFLPFIWEALKQGWAAARQHIWNRRLMIATAIVVVTVSLLALWPRYLRRDPPEALQLGQRLPVGAYQLLYALRENALPAGGSVLAWRDITDAIPAYGTTLRPVLFREDPLSAQRKAADFFYSSVLMSSLHMQILTQYNVRYLIVRNTREIVSQFDSHPEGFVPLFRDSYGVLYRVSSTFGPDGVIEANDAVMFGEWQGAIDQYNELLSQNPQDAAAHFGLGVVLELSNQPKKAAREFETVVELMPTDQQAHLHLVRIYRKLGMDDKAQAHVAAAGALMGNLQ